MKLFTFESQEDEIDGSFGSVTAVFFKENKTNEIIHFILTYDANCDSMHTSTEDTIYIIHSRVTLKIVYIYHIRNTIVLIIKVTVILLCIQSKDVGSSRKHYIKVGHTGPLHDKSKIETNHRYRAYNQVRSPLSMGPHRYGR